MEQFAQVLESNRGKLPAFIYEMLCTDEGYINKSFFEDFYELNTVSSQTFLKQLREHTGKVKFEPIEVPVNTVTKDEFFKHYEFGKFPKTLGWIFYFGSRGEVLTKQALFQYLIEDSKPRAHSAYGV